MDSCGNLVALAVLVSIYSLQCGNVEGWVRDLSCMKTGESEASSEPHSLIRASITILRLGSIQISEGVLLDNKVRSDSNSL